MGTTYRKRRRLGPLPVWLNLSWSERAGWSRSWTVKIGPWSWNSRTNASTIDLPGGWKHRHQHARRGVVPAYRRNGTPTKNEV